MNIINNIALNNINISQYKDNKQFNQSIKDENIEQVSVCNNELNEENIKQKNIRNKSNKIQNNQKSDVRKEKNFFQAVLKELEIVSNDSKNKLKQSLEIENPINNLSINNDIIQPVMQIEDQDMLEQDFANFLPDNFDQISSVDLIPSTSNMVNIEIQNFQNNISSENVIDSQEILDPSSKLINFNEFVNKNLHLLSSENNLELVSESNVIAQQLDNKSLSSESLNIDFEPTVEEIENVDLSKSDKSNLFVGMEVNEKSEESWQKGDWLDFNNQERSNNLQENQISNNENNKISKNTENNNFVKIEDQDDNIKIDSNNLVKTTDLQPIQAKYTQRFEYDRPDNLNQVGSNVSLEDGNTNNITNNSIQKIQTINKEINNIVGENETSLSEEIVILEDEFSVINPSNDFSSSKISENITKETIVDKFNTKVDQLENSPANENIIEKYQSLQDQVKTIISKNIQEKIEKVVIQLEPYHLGKLEVIMNFEDNSISKLLIKAEKSESLELLQKDFKLLEKNLEQSGIKIAEENISFNLLNDNKQEQNQQREFMENYKNIFTKNLLNNDVSSNHDNSSFYEENDYQGINILA